MVAYSFKARFADLVAAGEKLQTIRAPRKSRHARAGDPLSFYTGPRMQPRLIGRSVCEGAFRVELDLASNRVTVWDDADRIRFCVSDHDRDSRASLDRFAQGDGFANWPDMRDWFRDTHATDVFNGVLIKWGSTPADVAVNNAEDGP